MGAPPENLGFLFSSLILLDRKPLRFLLSAFIGKVSGVDVTDVERSVWKGMLSRVLACLVGCIVVARAVDALIAGAKLRVAIVIMVSTAVVGYSAVLVVAPGPTRSQTGTRVPVAPIRSLTPLTAVAWRLRAASRRG